MSNASPPLVNVVDLSVIDAFNRWAVARGMRGRDIADTVAKVMRYWVSFAMAKVPQGDAQKIRTQLGSIISSYSKIKRGIKTKAADKNRGTLAAAIVAIINYKGDSRELARQKSPAFYTRVNQFINARAYSANHHRSGFLPALNVLGRGKGNTPGAAPTGRAPKYAHPPGAVAHTFTDQLASILVENFASASADQPFSRPAGITGLAGAAFDQGLREVIKMIGDFLARDQAAAAREAGFTVTA